MFVVDKSLFSLDVATYLTLEILKPLSREYTLIYQDPNTEQPLTSLHTVSFTMLTVV